MKPGTRDGCVCEQLCGYDGSTGGTRAGLAEIPGGLLLNETCVASYHIVPGMIIDLSVQLSVVHLRMRRLDIIFFYSIFSISLF
jgi:hypothetical protein